MDKQIETAKSRKRNLFVATGIIAALAIGYGAYWGLVLSHQENTDDAYVAGHMVQLTPEVGGTVVKIAAEDTDRVNSGQTVVAFDNSDAKLAFERARNEFAQTVRETRQLMTSTQQLAAQVAVREAELGKAQADLKRRETLAGSDAISSEELGHARDAVSTAKAALDAAREQAKATDALVGKDVLAKQPNVQRAASKLKEAWLALQRTEVKAPVSGYVARRNVQVGQRVAAGTPLMVVVPLESVWVDANFKEVQLAKIRIGQDVELTADVYGSKVSYHGKVQGLSAGTGSAFSLLPAQNATGNWIKVVQRVPVRIQLDPKELKEHPLRVGLSVDAVVDISKQDGPSLADAPRTTPAQETHALTPDLKQADELVASLLAANAQ
ncbi:HlyD family efflux transporter periplasmic adaptor subunit [Aquitalea palustris]|uniref:HlyD family efflux transporter periplasmic adaptor subunit n=1 Tax=Aquitalea palustris TaxID=2480983 RepID=A0A454JLS0_9NEIS|nr:HlyD family efflux transporter periplasmic adaptor subunit [Aquitalea palustris]RMD00844.1 HlyD family efflux transporter periplasmic adaptor subunit [Aquitalea palustris]